MIDTMYIGSGDVGALLMGLDTNGHRALLQRFVSGVKPYYNAKRSPLDALRTGAILEDRYLLTLPDCYFPQMQCVGEMNVLKSTLDFARVEGGEIVDFDELKTCELSDFIALEPYRESPAEGLLFIKRNYKKYYAQIQQQLYCSGLDEANLVFLAVYSYDDEINYRREIKESEYIKFRIKRDDEIIALITKRASVFQLIKDFYTK